MFMFCKSIQTNHLKEPFQKKTLFAYKTSLFLQHFVFCFQYTHLIQTQILCIVACVIMHVCVWC